MNNQSSTPNKKPFFSFQKKKEIHKDKHSYNDVFQELQDYMFYSKNLVQYTKFNINTHFPKNKKSTKKQIVSKPSTLLKTSDIFSSIHKDSLFWCFYVLKHGLSSYEVIGNQHFAVEKKIKFEYINILRQKKELLKMNKIKPFTELEDDLANNQTIRIKTFIALCIVENINVMIIHKRKFYESKNNDSDKISIIDKKEEPLKYSMELYPSLVTVQTYRDTYLKMVGFDSTLKSIHSYKLDDLLDICKKINIILDTTKKNTKKDIYQEIILKF
jgi:hypothetical protein